MCLIYDRRATLTSLQEKEKRDWAVLPSLSQANAIEKCKRLHIVDC